MFNQLTAVALLALAASTSALECDAARYPWAGVTPAPTFDIVQPAQLQSYTKFLQGTLKITGKIRIINGCTFEMIDLGVEQAVQAAQLVWYGGISATDTGSMKVSESTFFIDNPTGSGQVAQGPYFSLTKVAGRQVSFYDVQHLRLFSLREQNTYATVTLSGGNMTQPKIGEPPLFPAPSIPAGAKEAPILVEGTGQLSQAPPPPPAASSPAAAAQGGASSVAGPAPTATTTKSAGVATKVSFLGVVAALFAVLV